MAVDKLVDSTQLDADLTAVADAIREKGGTGANLAFPNGFVSAVEAIETGGGGADALIDRSITSVSYDGTSIGHYAFANCGSLATVSFPNVTSVAQYAFQNTALTEITETQFPSLTSAGSNSFRAMPGITRVFLPRTTVGQWAFAGCTALLAAVFGGFTYNYNFMQCTALQSADISWGTVAARAFDRCSSLTTLVLRSASLQPLSDVSAFVSTPFASGGSGGTIYVPSALISSYQAATNWSTILGYANNSIAAIEGSIYETQYADGTAIGS